MIEDKAVDIDPALADEIEDAIMFGRATDLQNIIESISEDETFPDDLRQGLESLYYFRTHYGNEPLPETQKKKATLLEQSWAMELLNRVRARIEAVVKRA